MPPQPVHSAAQLGVVVRTARERAGRSQAALASAAGVERQWVVLLETGRQPNPTLRNVFAVLGALGLELCVGDAPDDEDDLVALRGAS